VTGDSIHDVKWNPNGTEFAVVYGDMPDTKVSIFDMKCQKIADLAETGEARNTLYYDLSGRILCVGGFGSLSGNMDFWDLSGEQIKKIGSTNAFSSSYHEWCPDSYHFVAGVVAPRMRIDNGIKIFNYNGELLYEEEIPELIHVHWRPQPPDLYPVQPIVAANPRAKKIAPVAAPKPYRHPHFSGNSSTVPQGAKATPTRYTPGGQSVRALPGGTLESELGSGKGRGKKKNKRPQGGGRGGGRGEQTKPPTSEIIQPPETTGDNKSIELDPEKRKRNVLKKLREIEVLKQRQDNGDTLDVAQLTKVATEDSLRAEMQEIDSN